MHHTIQPNFAFVGWLFLFFPGDWRQPAVDGDGAGAPLRAAPAERAAIA